MDRRETLFHEYQRNPKRLSPDQHFIKTTYMFQWDGELLASHGPLQVKKDYPHHQWDRHKKQQRFVFSILGRSNKYCSSETAYY